MSADDDRGEVLQQFPRTLVIQNWPFLVLLLLMGLVPAGIAWNPWLGGNPRLAAVVVGAVAVVVAIIGGQQLLAEALGASFPAAIHENGLMTRRLREEAFVPWARIEKIDRVFVSDMAGNVLVRVPIYEIWVRGYKKPVRLNAALHGDQPGRLIAQKCGLAVGGLG